MSSIVLSYTKQGGGTVTVTFTQFTDDSLPRTYINQASFSFSSKGTSLISGPAYKEKRIWAISGYLTKADAYNLDILYRNWDTDRAAGYAAVIGITDGTFNPPVVVGGVTTNPPVTTNGVISTPPTFNKAGPEYYIATVGLTEVS